MCASVRALFWRVPSVSVKVIFLRQVAERFLPLRRRKFRSSACECDHRAPDEVGKSPTPRSLHFSRVSRCANLASLTVLSPSSVASERRNPGVSASAPRPRAHVSSACDCASRISPTTSLGHRSYLRCRAAMPSVISIIRPRRDVGLSAVPHTNW